MGTTEPKQTAETCDVDRLGCEERATKQVRLAGNEDGLLDELTRLSCEAHTAFYWRTYVKERGYEMEVEDL